MSCKPSGTNFAKNHPHCHQRWNDKKKKWITSQHRSKTQPKECPNCLEPGTTQTGQDKKQYIVVRWKWKTDVKDIRNTWKRVDQKAKWSKHADYIKTSTPSALSSSEDIPLKKLIKKRKTPKKTKTPPPKKKKTPKKPRKKPLKKRLDSKLKQMKATKAYDLQLASEFTKLLKESLKTWKRNPEKIRYYMKQAELYEKKAGKKTKTPSPKKKTKTPSPKKKTKTPSPKKKTKTPSPKKKTKTPSLPPSLSSSEDIPLKTLIKMKKKSKSKTKSPSDKIMIIDDDDLPDNISSNFIQWLEDNAEYDNVERTYTLIYPKEEAKEIEQFLIAQILDAGKLQFYAPGQCMMFFKTHIRKKYFDEIAKQFDDVASFQEMWHNSYQHKFKSDFERFMKDDKLKFAIMEFSPTSHHSNSMFVNKKTMEVERYEPHGYITSANFLDQNLKKFFKKLGLTYIAPPDYQMLNGPQGRMKGDFDLLKTKEVTRTDIKFVAGSCVAWSVLYLHLRALSRHLFTRENVVNYLHNIERGELTRCIKCYMGGLFEIVKPDKFLSKSAPSPSSESLDGWKKATQKLEKALGREKKKKRRKSISDEDLEDFIVEDDEIELPPSFTGSLPKPTKKKKKRLKEKKETKSKTLSLELFDFD